MHRKPILSVAAVLAVLIALDGCKFFNDMQMPESVAVTSDATLTVPLGTAKYDISSLLGTNTLREMLQGALGSTAKLYDYIPADNASTEKVDESKVLTYLFKYPIYTVPVDVGSYLDDFDLDSVFNSDSMGFDFDQKITLPTIAVNQTETITIPDVSKDVLDAMKANMGNFDFPYVPEPAMKLDAAAYLNGHNSIFINGAYACETTYDTGSAVNVVLTRTDTNELSSDYSFKLTVKIVQADDESKIISESLPVEVRDGGTVTVNIATTLPQKVHVLMNGELNGGVNDTAHVHSYDVNMNLSNETKIVKIAKLNATASELGITLPTIDQDVSLASMVGYFTEATIAPDCGSVAITALTPDTWQGITCDSSIKIGGAGLTETYLGAGAASAGKNYFINKYLNLSGKTLTPTESNSSINVDGTLDITITDATITFVNGSSAQTIEVLVSCNVTKLASASIDFTTDKYTSVPTSYSLPTDGSTGSVEIPASLLEYVKSIDFCNAAGHYKHNGDGSIITDADGNSVVGKGFGLTCNVINSFPEGNDINISMLSNFFDFNKTPTIAGAGNTTGVAKTWNDYPKIDLTTYDSSVKNYIDFTFSMAKTLTLVNLVPGETYEFGIKDVSLVYDWDSIVLNLSSKTVNGNADLSAFSLNSFLALLPLSKTDLRKIQMTSFPIYFYAERPASESLDLGDLKFTGDVSLTYSYYDTTEKVYKNDVKENLIESGSVINFVNTVPWPEDASTEITSTSDVASHLKYISGDATGASFAYEHFETVMNKFPGVKNEDSDPDMSGTTLNYKLNMGNGSGTSDITVYSTAIDSIKNSTSTNKSTQIDINMVAVLSMNLNLTDSIGVDVMQYVDSTWSSDTTKDLLNRSSASDYDAFLEYIDCVKEIKLNYNITNNLFPSFPIALSVYETSNGVNTNMFDKDLTFNSGNNSITLTKNKIEHIFNEYPFHPYIKIILGTPGEETPLALQRAALTAADSFAAKVSFSVALDGKDNPIWKYNFSDSSEGGAK